MPLILEGSFHGVVPGKRAILLGQMDLPVTFGESSSFQKETLTFEVVGFKGAYHAILGEAMLHEVHGHPELHVPQAEMPGPHGVITMGSTYQRAIQCEVDSCDRRIDVITSEGLSLIRTDVPHETLDSNRKTGSPALTEDVKKSPLNP